MTMAISMLSVVICLVVIGCSKTLALGCSQTVSPTSYQIVPRSPSYSGTFELGSAVDGCMHLDMTDPEILQCDYNVILGDGTKNVSLMNCISIQSTHIDFDLTGEADCVTAIKFYFLNDPSSGISLPELELFTGPDSETLELIQSTIVDNQYLSQGDAQIRAATLRPLSPLQPHSFVRIEFRFTTFHEFEWMLVSEVVFRSDLPPVFSPQELSFSEPTSYVTMIRPSIDDLSEGLICTLSSQGFYAWQWERDDSEIQNGNQYHITVGDGSRTTKLTISNPDFSDAGRYRCRAVLTGFNISAFRIYDVYPEFVMISSTSRSSYNESENVTLTCKLYGYQSSFSPPVWLNMDGSEIATSDKYTISSGDGVNTIMLEDGTTLPSVVINVTIHTLTSADGGDYTCRGARRENVTHLTVFAPTSPPTTPPPITSSLTTPTPITPSPITASLPTSPSPTALPLTLSSPEVFGPVPSAEEQLSTQAITIITAMGIVILTMSLAILSLLITVALLMRRLKTFSTALVNLNSCDPVKPAQWSKNRAYQSETTSIDTEGYELVSEAQAGTTLSLNKAYTKRQYWLPIAARNTGELQYAYNCRALASHPDGDEVQLDLNDAVSSDEENGPMIIGNQGAVMGRPSDYLTVGRSDTTAGENPTIVAEATGSAFIFENPQCLNGGSSDNEMVLEVIMD